MSLLTSNILDTILFFDIETIPKYKNIQEFQKQEPIMYKIWVDRYVTTKESLVFITEEQKLEAQNQIYNETAGLYAETNQVVCISLGKLVESEPKIKSFCAESEDTVIRMFHAFLMQVKAEKKFSLLGGHNISGFDIPILIKKFVKYNLAIPEWLYTWKQKPWESNIVDTMQLFKFGGNVNTPLELLSAFYFGSTSKQGEINSKNIRDFWFEGTSSTEEKITKITKYCEKDVEAVMRLTEVLTKK